MVPKDNQTPPRALQRRPRAFQMLPTAFQKQKRIAQRGLGPEGPQSELRGTFLQHESRDFTMNSWGSEIMKSIEEMKIIAIRQVIAQT